MRRTIVSVLLIIVCFLLQTTAFQSIAFAGIVPNLLLIMTVFIGYINGCHHGIAAGMFCGLIIDCQYGSVIGIYALIYMIIGYGNGWCNNIYYRDDYTMPVILISISELFYGVMTYILEFLLRGRLNISYYFGRVIMPELIYTLILGIVMYEVILWMYHFVDRLGKGGDENC